MFCFELLLFIVTYLSFVLSDFWSKQSHVVTAVPQLSSHSILIIVNWVLLSARYISIKREMGCLWVAPMWPNVLLCAFPPLNLIVPTLKKVRDCSHSVILIAPKWEIVADGDNADLSWPVLASPTAQRPPLIQPCPGQNCSLGLAHERLNLNYTGLPQRVIETIQNTRAASTHSAYDRKWNVF